MIMSLQRCSKMETRLLSTDIRQLITGPNTFLGYQNNTAFIMPDTHNPCVAVWCALHRKVETSNEHPFQSYTFEIRAHDPYRMIDQACHISLVCGINNHFLTDFEKLSAQKKESNVMQLAFSQTNYQNMVSRDITKYQI